MPTKRELGKALSTVRQQYSTDKNRAAFAAAVGVADSVIRDREKGRTALSIADVIDYAKVLELTPVEFLAELLSNCDRDYWKDIANKLNCTVPMAKQRLAVAQKQHNLTHGQVWAKYLEEQIRL